MKLKDVKTSNIVQIGQADHIDFRISNTNAQVIMDLLSKGFYQNPIDSIVREYMSNAWDSHVEAGCVDEPIVVRFAKDKDKGGGSVKFIDYGVGLSPERVKEVFTVYFESSKRSTNDQIGSFGLGAKSAYAYTSSFFINTVYNGTRYTYLMSKNEAGISRLTKMSETETDERNGTEIEIPVNEEKYYSYSRPGELKKFYDACRSQLLYFENVYLDGGNWSDLSTFNDARIYHFNNFCYSTLEQYNNMHIKLGQCAYKMPWHDLGIGSINVPVALKFDIGELMPTPNREGIVLDEKSKQLIIDKIKLANKELVSIYQEQQKDGLSWKEFIEYNSRRYERKQLIKLDKDTHLDITHICNYTDSVKPDGISGRIEFREFLSNWYYSRKIRNVLTKCDPRFSPVSLTSGRVIYTISGEYNKYKNKYIAEVLHPSDDVYMIRARKLSLNQYKKVLRLYGYPKETWRARIIEYQKLVSSIWKSLPSYDKIDVPKEWIKSNYKTRQSRDLEGKIITYTARAPERVSENLAAYDKATYDVKKFVQNTSKYIFIYGSRKDRNQLDKVFAATYHHPSIKVMYTAESSHKILKQYNKKFMHVDDFDKKYNKFFARTVTAYMLKLFMDKNPVMFNSTNLIKCLNNQVGNDMQYISSYVARYMKGYRTYTTALPVDFLDSCWEVAKANKLYDHEAVAVYRRVFDFFDRSEDLLYLRRDGQSIDSGTLDIARRLLKSKVKLDVWKKTDLDK